MKHRLIIIEGLPGSGKTTVSQLVNNYLGNLGVETSCYLEGDLNHPADFDGIAFFGEEELNDLIIKNKEYENLINELALKVEEGYFINYAKEKKCLGDMFPERLFSLIVEKDIYELPLELHISLLLHRWSGFVQKAIKQELTYIFECCFIQNPMTIGMIRDNASNEIVFNYIKRLNDIIKPLNPLLIYLDQDDVQRSFNRIIEERPSQWLDSFIKYYTKQGFGEVNKLKGLNGTIEVLKKRKIREIELINNLEIDRYIINNSNYDKKNIQIMLSEIIK